jgi:hypothetical protein
MFSVASKSNRTILKYFTADSKALRSKTDDTRSYFYSKIREEFYYRDCREGGKTHR